MRRCVKPVESVLIKPAGPDCNMACRYCFYLQKQELFPGSDVHRMSAEVLEAVVRQVLEAGAGSVAFAWQGGEPTLMGVEFYQRAVELQQRYGRDGQVVGNGLQTNGLLIDDEWCRFLREAKFLIGLSLDGPAHVHDHYRKTLGGGESWARVDAARGRLLDLGVEVNAVAVVSDYSSRHAREIYEFFKEGGLGYMQFIPCLERENGGSEQPAAYSVGAEEYGRFLCDVFDCWRGDFGDGGPTTSVRWFESVFATYVDVSPPECTLLAECGTYVVVEHDGGVYACDFYVEPEWKLGNVLGGDLSVMLNSAEQARFGGRKSQLPADCQGCKWLAHCRGGCPKDRWGSSVGAGVNYFCASYRVFFEHADGELRRLAAAWRRRQAESQMQHGDGKGRRHGTRREAVGMASGIRGGRVGRNEACPCGSGLKYKRCCGR